MDFGTKIAKIQGFEATQEGNLITISLSDDYGNQEKVDIAVKSETIIQLDDPVGYVFSDEVMEEASTIEETESVKNTDDIGAEEEDNEE